jgi:hypothetical protein
VQKHQEPVTTDDVQAAARQYVRKISGYQNPPKYRTELFERAVDEVTAASQRLVDPMELSVK